MRKLRRDIGERCPIHHQPLNEQDCGEKALSAHALPITARTLPICAALPMPVSRRVHCCVGLRTAFGSVDDFGRGLEAHVRFVATTRILQEADRTRDQIFHAVGRRHTRAAGVILSRGEKMRLAPWQN